MKDKVKN